MGVKDINMSPSIVRRSTRELTRPCTSAHRENAVIAISPLIESRMPIAMTAKKRAKEVGTSDVEKSLVKPIELPITKPAIGRSNDKGPKSA
jgi:hypothetical protein